MERVKSVKKLILWAAIGISLLLGFIMAGYFFVKITRINIPSAIELEVATSRETLPVGIEVDGTYQQVYYVYKGNKYFVTSEPQNHIWARSSGKYIAWIAETESGYGKLIYLYDVVSLALVQLSFYGNAVWLQLDGGRVVWEDRTTDKPRIYLFNGSEVIQISDSKFSSVRPTIKNDKVAYAEEIRSGYYRIQEYDILTKKTKIVFEGESTQAWPRYEGDKLVTDNPSY